MRLVLFDWTTGGHHARYVRRFAEALAGAAEVVAAVPDAIADGLADLPVAVHPLGAARPNVDPSRALGPQHRELGDAELDLLERIIDRVRPDHVVHLYADPIIRRLVARAPLRAPTTLCVFFPRAHYPRCYATPLPPGEMARAAFQAYLVARWRRRPDAHALLTLDPEAARRWARGRGASAYWLPEPPVQSLTSAPGERERSGCIVYGALARRKGIDLLARALSLEPIALRVVLAGAVEHDFEGELAAHASAMERAGATVERRFRSHGEHEGLAALAGARCAVLPYPQHYGMSRVLVEACSVGTPVVAHHRGLLGHLVREHGLGLAVDCTDPRALRRAVLALSQGAEREADRSAALARFAARFSAAAFERAVRAPFVGRVGARAPSSARVDRHAALAGRAECA